MGYRQGVSLRFHRCFLESYLPKIALSEVSMFISIDVLANYVTAEIHKKLLLLLRTYMYCYYYNYN